MQKLFLTLFNHERYQSISFIIVGLILTWMMGCNSTVESIMQPGRQVTRGELTIEIDHLLATAKLRQGELDQKDNLKRQIIEHIAIATQTGAINPAGLVPLAFSILGVGALVDNTRKRKVIKTLNKIEPPNVG